MKQNVLILIENEQDSEANVACKAKNKFGKIQKYTALLYFKIYINLYCNLRKSVRYFLYVREVFLKYRTYAVEMGTQ